jgi:hypothetical protein
MYVQIILTRNVIGMFLFIYVLFAHFKSSEITELRAEKQSSRICCCGDSQLKEQSKQVVWLTTSWSSILITVWEMFEDLKLLLFK